MKRYMILTVGYQTAAIPYSNSTELAALVSAISEARQVDSKGYGDEQRYVPTSDEPLQFVLVSSERVTIGDEVATLKAQLKAATDEAASNQKSFMSYYEKANRLEKQVKELQTPPPPVQPAPSPDDDLNF